MGVFDALLRRAPGVLAQGMAGQFQGQNIQEAKARQAQLDQQELQRQALQEMLLQENAGRQRAIDARTAQERAEAARIAQEEREYRRGRDVLGDTRQTEQDKRQAALDAERKREFDARLAVDREAARARTTATGGGTGKILPASAVQGLSGMQNVLNAAEEAQKALSGAMLEKKNVTGPFTGRTAGIFEGLGMASPEAISVRAKLANVTSEIMKQRSGGAITPQEFVRLQPFLADRNDREEVAAQKLTDLITYLRSNQDTAKEGFKEAGYRVPGGPAATPEDEADAAAAAWLAKRKKP